MSKGVKKSLKGVEKPLKCVKKRQKVSKRRPKGDQKAAFKRRPKGDKKVSKSDQRCQNKKDVGHREMGRKYYGFLFGIFAFEFSNIVPYRIV